MGSEFLAGSVKALVEAVVPLVHGAVDGERAVGVIAAIVGTDRWNNFTDFHATTGTVVSGFREAGVETEVYEVPTGGALGTGKWVVQEGQDVVSATLDVVSPVQLRVADFRVNPWHAVQWTAGTPAEGMTCELVVVDTVEELAAIKAGGLRGKMVLTRLGPWDHAATFARKGAYGLICESDVKGRAEAVEWKKFGWGGVPLHQGAGRLVGMALSRKQGEALRGVMARHGKLRVHMKVEVRRFAGTHDLVSGIIAGGADRQAEVWAVAHSCEPGAIDNASGVACLMEAARVLTGLIGAGKLARPKRTIRMLVGYECYSFFHYLEHGKRFQTPLAGLCVDAVGVDPGVCGGGLRWHATAPGSAGFVNLIGAEIARGVLGLENAGYTLETPVFYSTEDTLLGDPQYGFPCPWLTNHPFTGYHSSADDMGIVSAAGMRAAITITAAYLYYLANAGTEEAMEWAQWETEKCVAELGADEGAGRVEYVRARHEATLGRVRRFFWTGEHAELAGRLQGMRERVGRGAALPKGSGGLSRVEDFIPRRKLPLSPTPENVFPPLQEFVGPRKWAVFWADGGRSIAEIHALLNLEPNCVAPVGLEWVVGHFRALEKLGYVELVDPAAFVGREKLVADLRVLGVKTGMEVMVHSSLGSIGAVWGGAETVVAALLEAIGPGGTLLAPSFNHGRAEVFNPLTTPTVNGAIPQAVWQHAGAVRSMQGTHAVAAIGARAKYFTADHLTNGIWAKNSPIGRLVHEGGYVLSIGVTHERSTAYHIAEIGAGAPCLDQFASKDKVVMADGRVAEVAGLAWRERECPVETRLMDERLEARGLQKHGMVGKAKATLVLAKDIFEARGEQIAGVCGSCGIRPNVSWAGAGNR